MILLLLFASALGVGLLELFVVIKVGEAIGVLPTLGLMVLDALVGSLLMRSQGRAVWRRFTAALAEGRVPAREVLDGVLVLVGGALLIAPGFVTDLLGAALLAPPTRSVIRRALTRRLARRLVGGPAIAWRLGRVWAARPGGARSRGPAGAPPTARPYDVEGSAAELDRQETRP